MSDSVLTWGNTHDAIDWIPRDRTGADILISANQFPSATVRFRVADLFSGVELLSKPAALDTNNGAADGKVHFKVTFATADYTALGSTGTYAAQFVVTYQDGTVGFWPQGRMGQLVLLPAA